MTEVRRRSDKDGSIGRKRNAGLGKRVPAPMPGKKKPKKKISAAKILKNGKVK